jgi:hypothetical protein
MCGSRYRRAYICVMLLCRRKVGPMEHWGIYVAYAWLATVIFAFTDAVRAIRKGPSAQPQPPASYNHN